MFLVLVSIPYKAYFEWNASLVWLDVVSSAGAAIASIFLSIFLIYFYYRVRYAMPYPSILLWFALFGIFCTADQTIDIYTTWVPAYYLSSLEKAGTTLVSLWAVLIIRLTISKTPNLTGESEITKTVQYESNTNFKVAFDCAAIGMALVGVDGRWLKVNRSLCEIVDYSEEELLTKTLQDITHSEDLEHDSEQVQEILEGNRENFRIEKRFHRKTGRFVWVLLYVSLVRNANGHPLHFIYQIQDITKRKTIEYGMIDLTAQLYSQVDELKSQEISERIEKILQEAELFEGLATKMRVDDV